MRRPDNATNAAHTGAGAYTVDFGKDTSVGVSTFDAAGAPSDEPFDVVVAC